LKKSASSWWKVFTQLAFTFFRLSFLMEYLALAWVRFT
jgi:hypothetical protein